MCWRVLFAVFWSSAVLAAPDCFLGPMQIDPLGSQSYGIGSPPDESLLAQWDIDVSPSGEGLPLGSGTVQRGRRLYATQCAACHGKNGEGKPNDVLAAPDAGTDYHLDRRIPKTVGNYWPFATTLFDYIRRAMPYNAPGSLGADEVYALTAYVLHLNDLLAENASLDAETLMAVKMPAAQRLRRYDECEAGDP